jgi:recombinase-like zinc beta ribbon protein
MAQWPVKIDAHHPAYLSWEEYVKNNEQMRQNWHDGDDTLGAAREGEALLQGMVYCGICGRKMGVHHHAGGEKRSPSYVCQSGYEDGDQLCQSMTSRPVDAAVAEAFLDAVSPLSLAIGLRAVEQLENDLSVQQRQRDLQLERARYEARLAQRQYDAVDPDNRLVASELERRWNEKLETLARLEQAYQRAEEQSAWKISAEERGSIEKLSRNLPALWKAPTTTNQDRKQLLRMAVESVQLDGVSESGIIEIQIRWRSGTITRCSVKRPAPGEGSLKNSSECCYAHS